MKVPPDQIHSNQCRCSQTPSCCPFVFILAMQQLLRALSQLIGCSMERWVFNGSGWVLQSESHLNTHRTKGTWHSCRHPLRARGCTEHGHSMSNISQSRVPRDTQGHTTAFFAFLFSLNWLPQATGGPPQVGEDEISIPFSGGTRPALLSVPTNRLSRLAVTTNMAQFQKEWLRVGGCAGNTPSHNMWLCKGGGGIDTEAAGDTVNSAALARRSNVSVSLSGGKPVENDSILQCGASSALGGGAVPTWKPPAGVPDLAVSWYAHGFNLPKRGQQSHKGKTRWALAGWFSSCGDGQAEKSAKSRQNREGFFFFFSLLVGQLDGLFAWHKVHRKAAGWISTFLCGRRGRRRVTSEMLFPKIQNQRFINCLSSVQKVYKVSY